MSGEHPKATSDDHNTSDDHPSDTIDLVVRARRRDLGGGVGVRRALPSMRRRLVGPFIFFDHMGPVEVPAGMGMDVRPHPHIALATITYLFDGVVFHRDSLGSAQEIRPGDVNWMIAGRGIAHSERTPPEVRAHAHRAHGIQAWVALRKEEEECEPAFIHHPGSALPMIDLPGASIRLIAGDAFGAHAPVEMKGKTLYADVQLDANASLTLPSDVEERAVYVVEGALRCDASGEDMFDEGAMIIFKRDAAVTIRSSGVRTRLMLLGGEPIGVWG